MFVKTTLMNKAPLLVTLLFVVLYKVLEHLTANPWLSLLVFIIPISLLIVNLSLRKRLRNAPWFLSSINFLLERKAYVVKSEIEPSLLFQKLLEVIEESQFMLLDTDEQAGQLLCGTQANFWTWGENIYINLVKDTDGTSIEFVSTTLFGGSSWNRNKHNFESFTESFESSLTI